MRDGSSSIAGLAFPATIAQTEAAARLRAAGRRIIPLASGDPDLPTPEHIAEAGIRAIRDGQTHYGPTTGTPQLRAAIAAKLASENGVSVGPDQVLVTPGAKAALFDATRAIVNDGDEVLVLDPSWVTYGALVGIAGGRPVRVQLDPADGYRIRREVLAEHIGPRTRAIMLNTPCNPTGRVATIDEIEAIGSLALEHDLFIVSDEIYEHLVYDGAVHRSPAAIPELADRTIIVNGFSKAYSMTGWRLGWLAGPPRIMELATRVHAQTVSSAATFTMAAGVAALEGPQDVVRMAVERYRARRERVLATWAAAGSVACDPSEGTFYLFPEIPAGPMDDAQVAAHLLEVHGIAAVPGSAFGEAGTGRLRLSLTAPDDQIDEAARAMAEAFPGLARA